MSSSPESKTRKISHGNNDQTVSPGIFSLALNLLATPLISLRPLLPNLFPLIVCLFCIPLLIFFSGAAGWVVWRNVPVGWKTDVHLQYGDATNPYANEQIPPVMADQPYDISLHLVIPATESNFALGNFMVTLRLTTAYNESITTVRRAATLVPLHASLLKRSFLGSPSTTKVDIALLSQFVFETSTVNARVELGRPDGWKGVGNGQARELNVVEATLKGTVRPRGIRAILARYPRLTTFFSTFAFFFISLMIVSVILLTSLRPAFTHPPSLDDSTRSELDDGHDSAGASPVAKRLSRRRSRKRNSESGSSAPEDEGKHNPELSGGVCISGLRKRKSNAALESRDTSQQPSLVKNEVNEFTSSPNTIPQLYPKSPFPRSSSTGSDTSSRRQNVSPNLVLASDAGTDSQ